jgi:hypothetical protein
VNAQNKRETLEWLNNHKKYITMGNPRDYNSENFKVEITDDYIIAYTKKEGEKYDTKLYWSQIKKTTLGLYIEENGYVTLNTKDEGRDAPSITLYLLEYSTEMRQKLARMAALSGTDVMMYTVDMRGKSLF